MSFDLVYKQIGDFGLYQKCILLLGWMTGVYGGLIFINSVFLLHVPDHRPLVIALLLGGLIFINSCFLTVCIGPYSITLLFGGLISMNYVFLLYARDHRCAIPGYLNDTYEVQNEAHQRLINRTIPITMDGTSRYDKCHLYSIDDYGDWERFPNGTLAACSSWVYDTSTFTSTLGAKLNLVCDRTTLKSKAQMIFFGGLLIGSMVTGIVSDRFGRKPTLSVSLVLLLAAVFSIAWCPSIEIYMFLSACVGCFSVGMFMPVFLVGMEFVGPSKRLYAGQFGAIFWTAGNLLMTGIAYLVRDWSTFQIVCAAPGVLFLSYWIIFPESPRWLYSQGRIEESKRIIEKAASVNKVKLSENFFEELTVPSEKRPSAPFVKLFSNRTLAIRTFVLYVNWIAVCMAYYGLALNTDGLGSENGIHLYFLLQNLMDIPAFLLCVSLIDRMGRRLLLISCMLIGGIACIATMFLAVYGGKDTSTVSLVLALIGKIGAATGFALVYQYSAELFPTVVRNAGMGSCSCMARIGGVIAPFVADLDRLVSGNFGKALPLLVFGCLSVVAGLLVLFLPETMRNDLPETIQDGIQFGRRGSEEKHKLKLIPYVEDVEGATIPKSCSR